MKKMIVRRNRIVIRREALSAGSFRAAFLTDLHNACGEEESARIFSALQRLSPDLVFCGGDMLIAHPGLSAAPARKFMKKLVSRYPVYAAAGNHEYRAFLYPEVYGSLYLDYTEPLKEAGVRFLENADARLEVRGVPLRVIGFDAPRRYYRRFGREKMPVSELTDRFGPVRDDEVTVLLAHNPYYYRTYFSYGADLTLCGHYHGGVMHLRGSRGLISPDFRIFPENAHGMMTAGAADRACGRVPRVFVGSGLGEHTIPFRICNPRELAVFDFRVTRPGCENRQNPV